MPGGCRGRRCVSEERRGVSALVGPPRRVLPIGAQSSLTGGATPRGDIHQHAGAHLVQRLSGANSESAPAFRLPNCARLSRSRASTTHLSRRTTARSSAAPSPPMLPAPQRSITAARALGPGVQRCARRGLCSRSIAATSPHRPGLSNSSSCQASRQRPGAALLDAGRAETLGGLLARPGMDLIDLFIGSEGTLGIVTTATLHVIPLAASSVALVPCVSDRQLWRSRPRWRAADRAGAAKDRGHLGDRIHGRSGARTVSRRGVRAGGRGPARPGRGVAPRAGGDPDDDEAALDEMGAVLIVRGRERSPDGASGR